MCFRRVLQEKQRSLDEMKEMSASRASLSLLDSSSSRVDDERLLSESSSNSANKLNMYKSYDSLDVSRTQYVEVIR